MVLFVDVVNASLSLRTESVNKCDMVYNINDESLFLNTYVLTAQ